MSAKAVAKRVKRRKELGSHQIVSFHLPHERLDRLESWAAEKAVTRSEAIRLLVGMALKKARG
jgi:hypothetical protein